MGVQKYATIPIVLLFLQFDHEELFLVTQYRASKNPSCYPCCWPFTIWNFLYLALVWMDPHFFQKSFLFKTHYLPIFFYILFIDHMFCNDISLGRVFQWNSKDPDDCLVQWTLEGPHLLSTFSHNDLSSLPFYNTLWILNFSI